MRDKPLELGHSEEARPVCFALPDRIGTAPYPHTILCTQRVEDLMVHVLKRKSWEGLANNSYVIDIPAGVRRDSGGPTHGLISTLRREKISKLYVKVRLPAFHHLLSSHYFTDNGGLFVI